jgi:UrcA family protein
MNTRSIVSGSLAARASVAGASILIALLGVMPGATIAGQPTATASAGSVADVPLSDLDLSTPRGMRVARERLHTMAEQVCADRGEGRDLSSQPAFNACVDSTVAGAVRHIDALRQSHLTALNAVTFGASVSLADLDLSTLEGARIARERLETTARRLCDELARRQDLSYPSNYAACLHDTLRGALAQADALAAAKNPRTARRDAP